jgi:hypothetical protein
MVVALQKQVAELKLARKQANEVVIQLMSKHLATEEARREFASMVTLHIEELDASNAQMLTLVIRTTLMGLNAVAQSTNEPATKQQVVEMIKALNVVIGADDIAATHKGVP